MVIYMTFNTRILISSFSIYGDMFRYLQAILQMFANN
jgi:hypothetical protein